MVYMKLKTIKRLKDLPGFPEVSWISVLEAATTYKIPSVTIHDWIYRKRLDAYKYYKMTMIPELDIPTYQRKRRSKGA